MCSVKCHGLALWLSRAPASQRAAEPRPRASCSQVGGVALPFAKKAQLVMVRVSPRGLFTLHFALECASQLKHMHIKQKHRSTPLLETSC